MKQYEIEENNNESPSKTKWQSKYLEKIKENYINEFKNEKNISKKNILKEEINNIDLYELINPINDKNIYIHEDYEEWPMHIVEKFLKELEISEKKIIKNSQFF